MYTGIMNRLLLFFMLALIGCAEPVKDIDRTLGNLVRKADLSGEWYMMETVTHLPATSFFTVMGETSKTERIRWEIQKDLLVGYRSYEQVRGAESPTLKQPHSGQENPIVAYPIEAHVDIRREYNPSTGEQSNVIGENIFDRLWFEREYVRVNWAQNTVTSFDFIAPTVSVTTAAYFVWEEQGEANEDYAAKAFYKEENEEGLHYFDVLGRLAVEPDFWGCVYAWWREATDDCSSAEIEVRSSFSKVPTDNDYEPFHYSDNLMSRFGYFRTEFFTHDQHRGVTEQGRRYMINRHNIWAKTRDGDQVIPIKERSIQTTPYYLSRGFPDDELLVKAAQETMKQWDTAMRTGLDALGVTDQTDVFVLCKNPVAEDDHQACGERGFSPRMGDLRYSTLHWIDNVQLDGMLGYGPASIDPITGETIAGKAYVYGAALNTWATGAVDVIRYFNGELEIGALVYGKHFINDIQAQVESLGKHPQHNKALNKKRLGKDRRARTLRQRAERQNKQLKSYDREAVIDRVKRAQSAGARAHRGNPEVQRLMQNRALHLNPSASPSAQSSVDPTLALNPTMLKKRREFYRRARAKGVDFIDMLTPSIEGLVAEYVGRTDYDQIWREVRSEMFASTAEHEVGHTLGLRHNYQGSYDSLNFYDTYWALREENLFPAETYGDIFKITNLTQSQIDGKMRQKQYSSIMDYGYSWFNDINGIGKYDQSALVFGYTAGGYSVSGALCDQYPSVPVNDGCIAQLPGMVEVFKKRKDELGAAGELLTRTEYGQSYDDPSLPSITALERFHYTTLALSFPSLDDLTDQGRDWMNYAQFLEGMNDENRVVRVPYLFCSDEWESSLVSCHAFDQGADPYEITRAKAAHYRAYYPFINYRINQPFFSPWDPYLDHFWYLFLPLSDIFQSWYIAPWGYDDLFDDVYMLAIQTGFNLLSEAITTPAYGEWCEDRDGRLIQVTEDPVLQGELTYSINCQPDGQRVVIPPGEGRRKFSIYDTSFGYYSPWRVQEAGHYWTTLAALEAMLDPDAYVLGVDGDAGDYAFGFYDIFTEEMTRLFNNLLTENHQEYSPYIELSSSKDEASRYTGRVRYRHPSPITSDIDGVSYDPETGQRMTIGNGGDKSLCEPCTADEQCMGYTGDYGGTYCQAIEEDDEDLFCLKDCYYVEDSCPTGTTCDLAGNCVPDATDCSSLVGACSSEWPLGHCDSGTCINGECVTLPKTVITESLPTFMLQGDIVWYGFLYTTSSFSTAFNDQLNVFRPGTQSEVELTGDGVAHRIDFTHPVTGVSYAAVQPNCPPLDEFVIAGHVGLCGLCESDRDCVGHTEYLEDIWCQPVDDNVDVTYCLRDCSENEEACIEGEVCDERGNCVPEAGQCETPSRCSPDNLEGSCHVGETCLDGGCVGARCLYSNPDDTGAVQMIKRGQALAQNYQRTFSDYERYDGDSASEDDRLYEAYSEAEYRLQNHVDLLETILATYLWFGHVY